mmetsp:Transcript_65650/g.129138  ORF Transcript_65650/g.129138 Transcript_65650/m.129138 type:complete len:198 (+) Transcript_65650:72-665(+)
MGGPRKSGGQAWPAALFHIKASLFRVWDSSIVLFLVWFAAIVSSVAVMSLQWQLTEARLVACELAAAASGSRPTNLQVAAGANEARRAAPSDGSFEQTLNEMQRRAGDQDFGEALRILAMVGRNILAHPGETRYQSIRKSNSKFDKFVGHVPGHEEVLRAMGLVDTDPQAWSFRPEPAAKLKLEAATKVLEERLGTN